MSFRGVGRGGGALDQVFVNIIYEPLVIITVSFRGVGRGWGTRSSFCQYYLRPPCNNNCEFQGCRKGGGALDQVFVNIIYEPLVIITVSFRGVGRGALGRGGGGGTRKGGGALDQVFVNIISFLYGT